MEKDIRTIDIRTILSLMAEGHVSAETAIDLLAEACSIEPQKLIASFMAAPSAKKARQASMKFTKWTPEDEQYVLEAWNRGDSIRSISDHLDRTKAAIRGRLAILQKNGHDVSVRRPATAEA